MIKKSILIAVAAFTVFVGFAGGCSTPSAVPMRPVFEFSHNQNQKQTEKSDYPDLNQMNVSSYFPNNKSTFVLKDLDSKQTYILNDNLANTRYAPQSTFKILNALIGLQTGAVADEYTVKRWDGKKTLPGRMESGSHTCIRDALFCCLVLSGYGPGYW